MYLFLITAKSHVTFISESLSVEYESNGIINQTALPSLVKTKLVQEDFKVPFFTNTPFVKFQAYTRSSICYQNLYLRPLEL